MSCFLTHSLSLSVFLFYTVVTVSTKGANSFPTSFSLSVLFVVIVTPQIFFMSAGPAAATAVICNFCQFIKDPILPHPVTAIV